jgi:hypothetical protein
MYEIAIERVDFFPVLPNNRQRVRRNNQLIWTTVVKNLRITARHNRAENINSHTVDDVSY